MDIMKMTGADYHRVYRSGAMKKDKKRVSTTEFNIKTFAGRPEQRL